MKVPVTAAIRVLRAAKVPFEAHFYRYEPRGGTAVSARELAVPEKLLVKTLVFEDDRRQPLLVLMCGHLQVSAKNLARLLGLKSLVPCLPETANKHTGYLVGGTSPFGTRKAMPVYMERRILEEDKVYINGGKRGFLVSMNPSDIQRVLQAELVEVGV